uniref:hypothetical protein n=1 Tax=Cupriavidus yeoncheonensis TaxID=1462994 RepID=UPI003F499156
MADKRLRPSYDRAVPARRQSATPAAIADAIRFQFFASEIMLSSAGFTMMAASTSSAACLASLEHNQVVEPVDAALRIGHRAALALDRL